MLSFVVPAYNEEASSGAPSDRSMRPLALRARPGRASFRFPAGTSRRRAMRARALICATVRIQRVVLLAAGCFVFCTRAAFDAAGGFDER